MQIPNSPLAEKFKAKHRCDCVALVLANRNAVYVGTGGRTIGGFCLPDESPRSAASRLAEEMAGMRLQDHYLAWMGTREFPIQASPTKVHLFLCHLDWLDDASRDFKKDVLEPKARASNKIQNGQSVPIPSVKIPQWSLVENSHLSSAKVQPVFKWLAEIINKPLPEVELPWERSLPLQDAERLMGKYNRTND